MKNQIYNPFLPLNEHVPDGEPHVFGDRIYIYGSHDAQNGDAFCVLDYVCYSAPVDDLSDWRYDGIIYRKDQDPENISGELPMYAPDVAKGPDGRFYLFYCLCSSIHISVAVCDEPAGKYEFLGHVKRTDGSLLEKNIPFDPAVINDNGKVYLYYGFSPTNINIPNMPPREEILGCSYVELDGDMLTIKDEPVIVIPSETHSQGTGFEGHEYFEAPSIRKISDMFYLVYSSVLSHELCYCTSRFPNKDFEYRGTIVSNGDIGLDGRLDEDKVAYVGNNHGGMECVQGKWYIFYHRHTHGRQFSRQACAESIVIEDDGSISQVEITSSGMNVAPLKAIGLYPAAICSTLTNSQMPNLLRVAPKYDYPYITSENEDVFVTNLTDGNLIGFKYFNFTGKTKLSIKYRGNGSGKFSIYLSEDKEILSTTIAPSAEWTQSDTMHFEAIGKHPLYLRYHGDGEIEIMSVEFS